jgi:hypothetical protein
MKNLKEEIQLFLAEKLIAWAVCLAPSNDEGARLRDKVNQYAKIAFNLKIGDKVDLGYGFISKVQKITRITYSTNMEYWCYNRKGISTPYLREDLKKVKS